MMTPTRTPTPTPTRLAAAHTLLLLAFVFVACAPQRTAAAPQYLGCFNDKFAIGERALPQSLFLEDTMTPDICEERCAMSGNPIMGVQYGSECWCGASDDVAAYGRYGKVADSECSQPCSGQRTVMCGGDLKNSVYRVTRPITVPGATKGKDERNLLALVMMVKDEAHTLPTTLLPLKPFLDYYYILDTGSKDGTPDAIRRTLGPNGQIHHEPFIDYGTSRNRVLDIAAQSTNPPPPVFVLMLSADETVHNAASLRRFCEQHRYSDGPQHEAYPVVMDVGWRFDSLRLSRTSKNWRYVGRVHEYLAAPDQKWHPTLRVPDTFIKFQVTDPERRSTREYTILAILLDEKSKHPLDTRTSFYLARTYNVIGNHTEALKEFRRRVSLGGWAEEVYESLFAIAWQLKALNAPWHEVQQAFLAAHQHSPGRAEPLYAIANQYFMNREYPLCFLFAQRAAQLPYPQSAVLWVQNDVYRWRSHSLVSQCGFEVGEYATGARAAMAVLDDQPKDESAKQMLTRFQQKLGAEKFAALRGGGGAAPANALPAPSPPAAAVTPAPKQHASPVRPAAPAPKQIPAPAPAPGGAATQPVTAAATPGTDAERSTALVYGAAFVVVLVVLYLCFGQRGRALCCRPRKGEHHLPTTVKHV